EIGSGLTLLNGILTAAGGGGGSSTFIGLDDTPVSYAGAQSRIVSVKSDNSGVEFRNLVVGDIPNLSSLYYSVTNPAGYLSQNQAITLTGAITGSGATSIATSI